MLEVVVGHSNDPETEEAIAEVLLQCQRQLPPNGQPQAGILLAAIDFEFDQLLTAVNQHFPNLELIGGTTDGEISSVLGFEQDSISLMLFCSDTITIRAGLGTNLSQDISAAVDSAVQMASQGHADPEIIGFGITIYESLTADTVEVLKHLSPALPANLPILGGLTADQSRFEQTYQFHKGQVYSDAITLLLFSGPLALSFGVNSGWNPISDSGIVTKQANNVVYEINDQPALAFYQYYFGNDLPSSDFPLAVFENEATDFYLRAPSGTVDEKMGSITFFGEVPLGARVQITEASRDDVVNAAQRSMERALDQFPGQTPSAAIYFSCFCRRQLLGSRAREEYEVVQTLGDRPIPSIGFYTNGEISPLGPNQPSRFHNETFVTLLLGEKDDSE